MLPSIRPEQPGDYEAIGQVNRLAFGGEAEARLVEQLRNEGFVCSSLVAELDGRVVGHILFSDLPIVAPETTLRGAALAPLAVRPEHQRQGIGSQLTAAGLDACRAAGVQVVVVLGHPSYYPRFGFSAKLAGQLDSPYSGEAFMALELAPGALRGMRGKVEYAPPFARL
jgi:putative acetyltransferase